MSTQDNPPAKYLAVPGAKRTLPVSAAKQGFSFDFADEARKYSDNFHYQMGGDHAVYYNLRLSEFVPVAATAGVPAGAGRQDVGTRLLRGSLQQGPRRQYAAGI